MSAAETLLVVYDSQAIRETVSVLGALPGYEVVEIDRPAEVEEAFARIQPDLVLVCAMTRETTAFESCRRVKGAAAGDFAPVLLYALQPTAELREQAATAGADGVLKVQISGEELLDRVACLLRIRQVVREAVRRSRSLACASAETAGLLLQIEEANRKIHDQSEALERMEVELRKRDVRIQAQQAEIQGHLDKLR